VPMSDEKTKRPRADNVIELRIKGKVPGSPGRAGREFPDMGDRKTEDALIRIRKQADDIDRSKYAKEAEPVVLHDPMEEDFCQYATSGYSLAAAWRKAYGREKDARGEYYAKKLSQLPRIVLRISEILEDRKAGLINDAERIRALISTRLEMEATTAPEGSVRLKALELLGKQPHVGAFEDRAKFVGVHDKSTSEEISAELARRLKRASAES